MKTLILLAVPHETPRVVDFVQGALGCALVEYHKAFNARCSEQMVEQIITGSLAGEEGAWYVENGKFPEEGTYFFDRISAEFDCVLVVRYDHSSGVLYIEVNKARLTSLWPGDRFVIPRESGIGSLFKPYNFAGELDVAG